jgi:hypothetical protein
MTRAELAALLDRLDPGAVLDLPAGVLAGLFPGAGDPAAPSPEVERFAEAHRCTFAPQLADAAPRFVKSDVY